MDDKDFRGTIHFGYTGQGGAGGVVETKLTPEAEEALRGILKTNPGLEYSPTIIYPAAEKGYLLVRSEDLEEIKNRARLRGAEEAWKFCNECYVLSDKAIKDWLESERRYPHGMTYEYARKSLDEFREAQRLSEGVVFWGIKAPGCCLDCIAYDSEYDRCAALVREIEDGVDPPPADCPARQIFKKELKEDSDVRR